MPYNDKKLTSCVTNNVSLDYELRPSGWVMGMVWSGGLQWNGSNKDTHWLMWCPDFRGEGGVWYEMCSIWCPYYRVSWLHSISNWQLVFQWVHVLPTSSPNPSCFSWGWSEYMAEEQALHSLDTRSGSSWESTLACRTVSSLSWNTC